MRTARGRRNCVVAVPIALMAASLSACGATNVLNCESPEWTQEAVFEMPSLRPRDSLELQTEIVVSDSTCTGVATTFVYPRRTTGAHVQAEVKKRALLNGWAVNATTGCLTRTFADAVTVLTIDRQGKKAFTVYANEKSLHQRCTRSR